MLVDGWIFYCLQTGVLAPGNFSVDRMFESWRGLIHENPIRVLQINYSTAYGLGCWGDLPVGGEQWERDGQGARKPGVTGTWQRRFFVYGDTVLPRCWEAGVAVREHQHKAQWAVALTGFWALFPRDSSRGVWSSDWQPGTFCEFCLQSDTWH